MVTLIVCVRRKKGLTHEEFSRHWREIHGPLVRATPEFMRHIRKYVQFHVTDRKSDAAPLYGPGSEWDGVAALTFDSEEAIEAAFNEPKYFEILVPDSKKFLDLENSMSLVTQAFPMVE